jgi:hypothetical protein
MAGQTPQFAEGTVTAVNQGSYTLDVFVSGREEFNVSYNPLAYLPRRGEKVWVALFGDNLWVMGVASGNMLGSPTVGRVPSVALFCDEPHTVSTGVPNRVTVNTNRKVWDTDEMLVDLHGDIVDIDHGESISMVTPRRTGLYLITAGGRWARNRTGRRGMDLRWTDDVTIARDEKAPNSEGECAHSVTASVRISAEGSPPSPWVRPLRAAIQLVVWQTSGGDLDLVSDETLRPFLQMTYQGPNP